VTEFQKPFHSSPSARVEADYVNGVQALQNGNWNAASRHFVDAARAGHVSALFNLSLLWGGGFVTPYDFDLAADSWYKAAAAGHPHAREALWQLEAADRAGFGFDNLAKFAEEPNDGDFVPSTMICAARFTDAVCRKAGATVDVIAHELDIASKSNDPHVLAFLARTGIRSDFFRGGSTRIKPGSAADQIIDGLNEFVVSMLVAGIPPKHAAMARCSIVGYVIAKSPYGDQSEPLRGLDTFFAA
jgi:hypothetical protein